MEPATRQRPEDGASHLLHERRAQRGRLDLERVVTDRGWLGDAGGEGGGLGGGSDGGGGDGGGGLTIS